MDVNAFTSPFQLTKSMHRDIYPALDPTNPHLSASGKVVLITGAGGRIGSVSACRSILTESKSLATTILPSSCKSSFHISTFVYL